MIELNVLKTRLEKFRKQRVVLNLFIIYFAGLLFLFAILAMSFIGNKVQINRLRSDIKKIELKIAAEKEKVDYIREKEKESKTLLKNLELFASEYKKRVLWSPVLAFTGQMVPPGIWLERFSLRDVSSQEKEDRDKRIIVINGYVLPGAVNEREAIDRFVRNMSRGTLFEGVYLKEVKKGMQGATEVKSFNIECELKGPEVN